MSRAAVAALNAGSAVLASAAIRQADVPEGFLPAEDQQVFRGLRPSDPECARLLGMVDDASSASSKARRDVSQSHAAFYRADPAASLVEHVLRLPSGEAARRVDEARRAVANCPTLDMGVPGATGWNGNAFDQHGLTRARLNHPETLKDAVAVRYSHPDGGSRYGLDLIFARANGDLLILAAPGEFSEAGEKQLRATEARVLRKLADAHDRQVILTPGPSLSPSPRPRPKAAPSPSPTP